MKVKEFIQILKTQDPELPIKYFNFEEMNFKDVSNVEIENFFAGTNDVIYPDDVNRIENVYKEKVVVIS